MRYESPGSGYTDIEKTDRQLVITWVRMANLVAAIIFLGAFFSIVSLFAIIGVAIDKSLLFHPFLSFLSSHRKLQGVLLIIVLMSGGGLAGLAFSRIEKLLWRRNIGFKKDVFTFDRTLGQFLKNGQAICAIRSIKRIYVDTMWGRGPTLWRLTLQPKRLTKMRICDTRITFVSHVAKEIADYTGLKKEVWFRL
jgi:hypothetical protein